jgi:hypothetical protein
VLTLLAAGGALEDFPAGTYRALPRQLRARLAPELAAASSRTATATAARASSPGGALRTSASTAAGGSGRAPVS